MIKNKIGENAGKIWHALNEKGEMSIKELKKATMLIEKDLYLALGWLSKERKVLFGGDKKDDKISLTEN